ncbi:MAG: hypothetical protein ACKVP4_01725 [Hyphomicrobium sp.]
MTFLLAQTFLLLLAAYFAGAFVACLAKRWILAGAEPRYAAAQPAAPLALPAPFPEPPLSAAAAAAAAASRVPALRPVDPVAPRPVAPQPRRPRVEARPRSIELVQPKIDLLPRPAPRPLPSVADTDRFERALRGPDPNEGMPRRPILEIRPAVYSWVTGPPGPWPPPRKPDPIPEPEPEPEAPIVAASADAKPRDEKAIAAQAAAASEIRARSGVSAAAANAAAAASAALAAAKAAAASIGGSKTSSSSEPAKDDRSTPVEPARQPSVTAPSDLISGGDDLQRIRAIDAETEQALKREGVTKLEAIARWTAEDVELYDEELKLQGRIDKEQWVEQAQILAKGGETYYSRNRAAAARAAAATTMQRSSEPSPAVEDRTAADDGDDGERSDEDEPAAPIEEPAAQEPETDSQPVPASALPPPRENKGKSVGDIAAAAAAAIAAASASVTRGIRPIEPISPLSKVDRNLVIPTKLTDALKDKAAKDAGTSAPQTARPTAAYALDDEGGDDLKRIRGVGVLIEKRLKTLGVTTYAQIANWTSDDIDRVSQQLDFKGRVERESWVEQARILSSGGKTEFSSRVDRGDVESSKDG